MHLFFFSSSRYRRTSSLWSGACYFFEWGKGGLLHRCANGKENQNCFKLVSVKPVCSSSTGFNLVQKNQYVLFCFFSTCALFSFKLSMQKSTKPPINGEMYWVGLNRDFLNCSQSQSELVSPGVNPDRSVLSLSVWIEPSDIIFYLPPCHDTSYVPGCLPNRTNIY